MSLFRLAPVLLLYAFLNVSMGLSGDGIEIPGQLEAWTIQPLTNHKAVARTRQLAAATAAETSASTSLASLPARPVVRHRYSKAVRYLQKVPGRDLRTAPISEPY